MSECSRIQELISALVDGEVSESEKTEIEKHVEVCPECKAMLAAFTAVSESLSALEEVPEGIHEGIMREVKNEGKRKKSPWLKILPLAACFALVIFTAFSLNGREAEPMDNMPSLTVKAPSEAGDSTTEEAMDAAVNGSAELGSAPVAADRVKSHAPSSATSEKLRELLTPVKGGDYAAESAAEMSVHSFTVILCDAEGEETVQIYFDGDTAYADFGEGFVEVTGTADEIKKLIG